MVISVILSAVQALANAIQATAQVYGLIPPMPENEPKKPVFDCVAKICAPNINGLETLEKPLNKTLSYLTQRWEVKGIQIHGTLGTGKTTIMQNLNNHELVAKIFDTVIWLKVSSDGPDTNERINFSVEKLQKDVMSRLNLDYKIPVDHYRDEIKKTLKDTKYLLLLDNVKAALSLDEIGFPENWEERSSKVVFTTRFKGVWRSMTDRSVEVGLLNLKDATTMFSNILKISGSSIEMDYIHQAVKHCGRLVTAIKIVADHIKFERDEQILKDKLNALKTWPRDGDDMITDIIRTIGFCCEDLTNEQRGCFYYGALYPEESNIYKDHLLDCWMAENNFVETKAHWRNLLKHLNDRNLFEEDEHKKYVRMHKLIRLLALYNLQTDGRHICKCLVPSKKVSSDQQDKDSWEGKHWISLADKKYLMSFSDSQGCPNLSTLFLQGNSDFTEFPDSFNTKSLRVLNLMGTSIESLPDSLKESKELAVLAISGTENISEVLSKLDELQEMLIDTKSKKETFDWQVINYVRKRVKTLRSLRLRFLNDEVVDVWEVDDGVRKFFGNQISNDAELDMLFQRYVECYSGGEPSSTIVNLLSMPNALVIAKRDDLENLDTFNTTQSAAILVENCEKIKYILGPVGILSSLEQLYLNDMEELESVTFGMFSLANFGKLKTLELRRCVLLTNIITADAMLDEKEMSTRTGQEHIVFPMLEKLVLVDMPKLEGIWKDELLEFPALIEVEISKCLALKYLPISPNNTEKLKSITTERTWWDALNWDNPAAKEHFRQYLQFEA